ncbi:TetR/AcrR family transcriptional regulator [Spirillospora sp. CA-294931]|uniref:TetR/AcrR family transcriptional regulator n=1 Tax=Spirillospora sp. CA-294931 TaxID=3240042 RepID=UPI003D91285F
MPTHARERLVRAAEELFYTEGIHAVGVERLLSASGVGRASFYRHFAGKDDLVATVLRERDASWRQALAEEVAARGNGPLDVFDVMAGRYQSGDFHGCSFINAMAEIGDRDHTVYAMANEHKRAVADYFKELLRIPGPEGEELAQSLVLLLDGATVTALRDRSPEPALRAKAMAALLLREHAENQ